MNKKQLPPNERPHNRPYLQTRRTRLRKHLTPAEATLWKALQGSKLEGRKFRRQHSVGNYILDFYCDAERLAVELDGEVHRNDQAEVYDYERKLFLNELGIKVIRFENRQVFEKSELCRSSDTELFRMVENKGLIFFLNYHPVYRSGSHPS